MRLTFYKATRRAKFKQIDTDVLRDTTEHNEIIPGTRSVFGILLFFRTHSIQLTFTSQSILNLDQLVDFNHAPESSHIPFPTNFSYLSFDSLLAHHCYREY